MPRFSDIYKQNWRAKVDAEKRAAAIMRSEIGQQAIRESLASYLWDWAMKNPDRDPPGHILEELRQQEEKLHRNLSLAAAGEPGPLTANETPTEASKGWAAFALEQIKRREDTIASRYC